MNLGKIAYDTYHKDKGVVKWKKLPNGEKQRWEETAQAVADARDKQILEAREQVEHDETVKQAAERGFNTIFPQDDSGL